MFNALGCCNCLYVLFSTVISRVQNFHLLTKNAETFAVAKPNIDLFSLVKKIAGTNFSTNKTFFMLANRGINGTKRCWSSVFTLPSKKNNSMQVNFPISNITIRNSMRSCQTSVFSNLRTPSVFSKTI